MIGIIYGQGVTEIAANRTKRQGLPIPKDDNPPLPGADVNLRIELYFV
jgi:hypothetical protein